MRMDALAEETIAESLAQFLESRPGPIIGAATFDEEGYADAGKERTVK